MRSIFIAVSQLWFKTIIVTSLAGCQTMSESRSSFSLSEDQSYGENSDKLSTCLAIENRIDRSRCALKAYELWTSQKQADDQAVNLATGDAVAIEISKFCADFANLIYVREVQGNSYTLEKMEFRNRCHDDLNTEFVVKNNDQVPAENTATGH